jgi:hypothetical protein
LGEVAAMTSSHSPSVFRHSTPGRVVTDYTPEELAGFADAFRSTADRFRRRRRAVMAFVLVPMALYLVWFALSSTLPGDVGKLMFPWFLAGFFLCWVSVLCLFFLTGNLRCPACRNEIEAIRGPYCPECGERALQPRHLLRPPECRACGRIIRKGKHFGYVLRVCNHCGVVLDEKGIHI